MDIRYLNEFTTLAETGNYLEAAETLFISQSSLSKHIKKLEEELDIILFDRSTRKVKLSPEGRILYEYAAQIVQLDYQARSLIRSSQEQESSALLLGAIPVMFTYNVADLLFSFQKWNSNIRVQLLEKESKDLKGLLRDGKLEAAFIRDVNEPEREFIKVPYEKDRLVAVLPKFHPLACRQEIPMEWLRDEKFLLLNPDTLMYDLCRKSCIQAGFEPSVVYTGQRAENILALVEKGMGISLLMEKPVAALHNENVVLIPVSPAIETWIKLYYPRSQPVSPALKHFIGMIQTKVT